MEKLTQGEWDILKWLLDDAEEYNSENDDFPHKEVKALREKLEQGLRP